MRSRRRPLALSIGDREAILLTSEANVLIAAGERLHSGITKQMVQVRAMGSGVTMEEANTLDSLLERLANEAATTADPPVRIETEDRLVLRRILTELKGYQRGDLTLGLQELRVTLDRTT